MTRRARLVVVAAVVAAFVVGGALPALAFDGPPSIVVGEDEHGVAVRIDASLTGAGSSSGGNGGRGGGTPCTYELASFSGADSAYVGQPADVGLFTVQCGSFVDVRFLRLGPDGTPVIPGQTVDPLQFALSARDRLPLPAGQLRANPTHALVGLPTWYWFEGYDGRPLTKTVSAFGVTVQVQATPTRFRWDFGDGATMTSTDLGRPFPQPSTITHTYQAARPNLTVACTFEFGVRWRVPGGPWTPLPPISRTATAALEVAQSQTVVGR
jgi:hypothetical protein